MGLKPRVSDLADRKRGLRTCIPSKFPGVADMRLMLPHLENLRPELHRRHQVPPPGPQSQKTR